MESIAFRMNRLLGRLRRIYFMALPENEADYRKSRKHYIAADTMTQIITNLAGGSFMISLMLMVGFSDAVTGTMVSVTGLAALFQLLVMQKIDKLKKRKLFVCVATLLKAVLALLFVIPSVHMPQPLAKVLVVFCVFGGQICTQVVVPAVSDWIASLVPARFRGSYLARKDAVAVFVLSTMMLVAGIFMDEMAERNQEQGFLILGVIIFMLVLLNFLAYSRMKEPRSSVLDAQGREMHGSLARRYQAVNHVDEKGRGKFGAEIKEAFQNQAFRKAFWVTTFWYTISYGICSFHGGYLLKELGLSFTFLMILNFASNIIRVAVTPCMGRLGDAFGIAFIYKYCMLGHLMCIFFFMLAVPSNAYIMIILGYIFSALGASFTPAGLLGIQLELIEEEKRTLQLSILNSLSGLFGFLMSLAAGRLVDALQKQEVIIGSTSVYAQQVLNALGVAITIAYFVYLKYRVQENRPKSKNLC